MAFADSSDAFGAFFEWSQIIHKNNMSLKMHKTKPDYRFYQLKLRKFRLKFYKSFNCQLLTKYMFILCTGKRMCSLELQLKQI